MKARARKGRSLVIQLPIWQVSAFASCPGILKGLFDTLRLVAGEMRSGLTTQTPTLSLEDKTEKPPEEKI